jgi:hypothetical protein
MDKYEQHLGEGGRVVGNMIGWGLRRLYDALRNASERNQERPAPRPGDPNRVLPNWQMEVCERAVGKGLAGLDPNLVEAIKQPARQLCIDLLLYEKKHRKSYTGKVTTPPRKRGGFLAALTGRVSV